MSLFKPAKSTIFKPRLTSSNIDEEYKAPSSHGENTKIKNNYILDITPDVDDNIVDDEFKGEENYDQYIQNGEVSNVEIKETNLKGAKILADDDVDNSFIKNSLEKLENLEKLECYKNDLIIRTIKEIKNNEIIDENNNELKLSESGEILENIYHMKIVLNIIYMFITIG